MHINHFFLPYCKNLCSFFAFFGLPCAHQSFFFLPYCKNLCTFFAFFDLECAHQLFFLFSIVRIYILSLFFVYISIIFFFYKNLCTFFFVYSMHFRIRINVLESIHICLESTYFFLFFFTACRINVLEIGYVSYVTFTIKKRDKPNYFSQKITKRIRICILSFLSLLYFSNAIVTNQLQQLFFSSYFGNAIATNSFPQFFPLNFGNAIATNQLE